VNGMVTRPTMSRVPSGDSLRLRVLLGTKNGCKNVNQRVLNVAGNYWYSAAMAQITRFAERISC